MKTQRIANSFLRAAGKLLPETGGIDYRAMGRLHRLVRADSSAPWRAGNGFMLESGTTNAAYVSGVNERFWLDFICKQLPNNGLIVNVGANIGYTALYLAKYATSQLLGCSFMAVEPEPDTFKKLSANIALNPRLVPIEPVEAAAGETDGVAEIFTAGPADGSASFDPRGGVGRSAVRVRVRRLDDVLAAAGRVAGMVMDVEGFGGAALRGAHKMLEQHHPFIAAEIHSARELDEMESVMLPLGYQCRASFQGVWGDHRLWAA